MMGNYFVAKPTIRRSGEQTIVNPEAPYVGKSMLLSDGTISDVYASFVFLEQAGFSLDMLGEIRLAFFKHGNLYTWVLTSRYSSSDLGLNSIAGNFNISAGQWNGLPRFTSGSSSNLFRVYGSYGGSFGDFPSTGTTSKVEEITLFDNNEFTDIVDEIAKIWDSKPVQNPITYISINSTLSGPESASSSDIVNVSVSFPDGYIYQEQGVSIYNKDGAIPFSYDNGTLTFTMP